MRKFHKADRKGLRFTRIAPIMRNALLGSVFLSVMTGVALQGLTRNESTTRTFNARLHSNVLQWHIGLPTNIEWIGMQQYGTEHLAIAISAFIGNERDGSSGDGSVKYAQ